MRVSGLQTGPVAIPFYDVELDREPSAVDSIVQRELSGNTPTLSVYREKTSEVYEQLKVLNYGQLVQEIQQSRAGQKPELIRGLVVLVEQAVTMVRKELGHDEEKKSDNVVNRGRTSEEDKEKVIELSPIAASVGLNLSA